MSGNYEVAAWYCFDPRFQRATRRWVKGRLGRFEEDIGQFTLPGTIIDLARPREEAHRQLILDKLSLAVNDLGIKHLIVVNHGGGCLGYRAHGVVLTSEAAERQTYSEDFKVVRRILGERFPGLEIEFHIAWKRGDEFEFEEVDIG